MGWATFWAILEIKVFKKDIHIPRLILSWEAVVAQQ
jgi:hypothetical protein